MTTDSDREKQIKQAEDLYLKEGLTHAVIADRMGLSLRTVQRWSKAGGWTDRLGQRRSPKIVSIKRKEERAAAKARVEPIADKPISPLAGRQCVRRFDEQEIVVGAIVNLSAILSSSEIDTRAVGSLVNALIRALEYNRKINPPDVAELAEQIVEMGVSPTDLVKALKIQWEKLA